MEESQERLTARILSDGKNVGQKRGVERRPGGKRSVRRSPWYLPKEILPTNESQLWQGVGGRRGAAQDERENGGACVIRDAEMLEEQRLE